MRYPYLQVLLLIVEERHGPPLVLVLLTFFFIIEVMVDAKDVDLLLTSQLTGNLTSIIHHLILF